MTNSTYLAQVGHFLFGYAATLTVMFLVHNFLWALLTASGILLFAALKEFWYDAKFEIPEQTDFDNWLDFGMYFLGTIAGCLVAYFGA